MSTPSAPTLMKQMPNRVGNQSIKPANTFGGRQRTGGVTNPLPDVAPKVSQPKGAQGAPKANGNVHIGNKGNAMPVDRPKANYGCNDGYRAGSSFLK